MTELLQRVLPTVQKPARYTGGEWGEIKKDLSDSIEGKHLIIVEDILDSGNTLYYLRDVLWARKPASIRFPPKRSGMLSADRSPLPTSTRVPTRIRTILCRNPLPVNRRRTSSPIRRISMERIKRTVLFFILVLPQKLR